MSSGSNNNSSRPVYVPAHKRKRFHGAFTGGFSAGYFNTVGSKEGWKPREDVREEQSTQDFMDDQDHNEWGGPTSVKRDFVAQETEPKQTTAEAPQLFEWIQPPPNVGTRLLRVLGWREGTTAYVPTDGGKERKQEKKDDTIAETVLSQKRLKRIQLQETRVHIPPPKLDAGGLGYDVYRDAPEFQAHREKRRREAQERSRAATTEGANAYRLSDLHVDDDDKPLEARKTSNVDTDDPYLSYETTQDFIGTKSVGGFALREDADDVYDEKSLPKGSLSHLQVDKEQYDTVIYDHESDDEDTDKKMQSVGGILSSWATGDSSAGKGIDRGVTSDGRPPLPGFQLGGAAALVDSKRYPGPELPANYVLKKHEFREDEHPAKLAQMAKQEQVEQKRHQAFERMTGPMTGGAFSGLAAAMKSRFTAATPTIVENMEPTPVGLHQPLSVTATGGAISVGDVKTIDKEAKIERTFLLFYPDPLVCKRLGVTPPAHSKNRAPDQRQSAESAFFEKEVLKQAADAKPMTSLAKVEKDSILKDESAAGPKETDQRPALVVYKSIFEPNSESDPDEGDDDGVALPQPEFPVEVNKPTETQITVPVSTKSIVLHVADNHNGATEEEEANSGSEGERRRKKRKRRKREDKRRRRRRSHSLSSSDTDLDASSSEDEGRRRRRKERKRHRRKDDKKKRKKHKSSRRKEE